MKDIFNTKICRLLQNATTFITKCIRYYKIHSYYRMLKNIPASAVSQNIIALVFFFVFGAGRREQEKGKSCSEILQVFS